MIACSRLRDSGGKSFSNKKCEKRAGAGERVLISLLISSHYVYYLRAWHRLMISKLSDSKVVFEDFFDFYREREKTKKWKAFEWENFADKS